uniref:(northern house mosquito) hypothetical protein n=1 Tax=Culex pipiens TaxID=7175 RepID=A0A8D8HAC0_CULPI
MESSHQIRRILETAQFRSPRNMTLETSQILNSCLHQQNLRQSWYRTNDCKRPTTLKWLDNERHPHLLRQSLKDVEPQERLSWWPLREVNKLLSFLLLLTSPSGGATLPSRGRSTSKNA